MSHESALALIREGWELHAHQADSVSPLPGHPAAPADPDLDLLLGDRLYASGLLELVRLDDLAGVRRMADVISECARALAESEPERADRAWAHLPTE